MTLISRRAIGRDECHASAFCGGHVERSEPMQRCTEDMQRFLIVALCGPIF
jgi:hypothetical protein